MWFQLKIESCAQNQIERLSEELEQLNAVAISLTDQHNNPVLEPLPGTTPLWPEVIIEALFTEAQEAQDAQNHLMHNDASLKCTITVLEDKDWEKVWIEDFKPQRFGNKLWVCPTWSAPPQEDAINLILDPGLAFGTGTHPTTALCLTWLEQADLKDKHLIDYGCGSGILSLAALKLGSQHVDAVDIDPQALQATQNNASLNAISEEQLSLSQPESLTKKVDLVIANILLNPLMTLKQRFYQLLHQHGHLIVSGLIEEQAPLLIETYKDSFTHLATEKQDGWCLLVFSKNNA